jgi:hypothetical protein
MNGTDMTRHDEAVEAMARGMYEKRRAWWNGLRWRITELPPWEDLLEKDPEEREMWIEHANAALSALRAYLAANGLRVVGPEVSEYMRETVREHGGNQAVAYLNALWSDAIAAAPDPLEPGA